MSCKTTLHVCSLSHMPEQVARLNATHLVSLVSPQMHVPRPTNIYPDHHLTLHFNDIHTEQSDLTAPNSDDINQLINFVQNCWDKTNPLVIHCWFGVSRSTAGCFIAACLLQPEIDEEQHAKKLRAIAPFASPNPLLVQLADNALARNGRMVKAIKEIGRGVECSQGTPFSWNIK